MCKLSLHVRPEGLVLSNVARPAGPSVAFPRLCVPWADPSGQSQFHSLGLMSVRGYILPNIQVTIRNSSEFYEHVVELVKFWVKTLSNG